MNVHPTLIPIITTSNNVDNSLWGTIRAILEAFYFFSGVALVFVSIKALGQIKTAQQQITATKEDTITRSQREATTETIKQCREYPEKVFTLFEKIVTYAIEEKIEIYKDGIKDFEVDNAVKAWLTSWGNKLMSKENKFYVYDLLNYMEAFSMYYMHRVCDADIAFNPISNSFLSIINALYPIICAEHYPNQKCYSNLIGLCKIWLVKEKEKNIKSQRAKAFEELRRLNEASQCLNIPDITPLGTSKVAHK